MQDPSVFSPDPLKSFISKIERNLTSFLDENAYVQLHLHPRCFSSHFFFFLFFLRYLTFFFLFFFFPFLLIYWAGLSSIFYFYFYFFCFLLCVCVCVFKCDFFFYGYDFYFLINLGDYFIYLFILVVYHFSSFNWASFF